MIIEQINSPKDLKTLNAEQRKTLATEIREALINKIAFKGGHFGPNLGIVETTIAIHTVFDSPIDKIVFDVSHQTYPHKMLTGRKDAFLYKEHYFDVTGFTDPAESEHDHFTIGHTSTSVSLALGMAKARDLKGESGNVIALIGDGSLSGGEALEALDYAGEFDGNFIIIVNDNDMSIAENHGGIYKNLKELRESNGTAQNNLFKAMGLDYVFVDDGNDCEKMIQALSSVKDSKKPVVVHIVTIKGKGYKYAEENKENWHFHAPFNIETGESLRMGGGENYGTLTAEYLLAKMKKDPSVLAMNAGTPTVFGFDKARRDEAGKQFIDVGIAEENVIAMASGVAKNGAKPVVGIYSTFMQRSYDQIAQDVCVNKSPITMLVYGASVWGMADVTHCGMYDIPMISHIPELTYLAPTCKEEYFAMLEWSIEQNQTPVAIRVPACGVVSRDKKVRKDYSVPHYDVTKVGKDIAIIALGDFYDLGESVANELGATLVDPVHITGLDEKTLNELSANHKMIVTLEDGVKEGGFGEKIASYYGTNGVKVMNFGFKKEFHNYKAKELLESEGLTVEKIVSSIKENL